MTGMTPFSHFNSRCILQPLTQPMSISLEVDGITGYHEFPSLAEDYESRAQKYREAGHFLELAG